MTSIPADPTRRSGAEHPGPPPVVPAVSSAVTLLLGVFAGPISGHGAIPSPFASAAAVSNYFATASTPTEIGAWLLGLSAVALLMLGAVLYSRLNFLAPNAPGPVIAGFGGVAAAGSLTVSAAATWALGHVGGGDPEVSRAMHFLNFAVGGPLHTASLGVLVLGLGVTSLFIARTPRWLAFIGIGIAVVAFASTLSLLAQSLVALVPIGRFAAILWLIAITAILPRRRAARGLRNA